MNMYETYRTYDETHAADAAESVWGCVTGVGGEIGYTFGMRGTRVLLGPFRGGRWLSKPRAAFSLPGTLSHYP